MKYILIRLSPNNGDKDFYCYQEVDVQGNLVCHKDLFGNVITPVESSGYVLDPESPFPDWGIPD